MKHTKPKLKKPIKGKAIKKAVPMFDNGTTIREAALVTDRNGVSWWVDPTAKSFAPISAL